MRAVVLAVVVLAGCGQAGRDRHAGSAVLDGNRMAELLDHPERFKGQTLLIRARVDSAIFDSDSLRNYAGRDVTFAAPVNGGAYLRIAVRMPSGDLPNAHYGDRVVVEFVCNDGRLDSGNAASKVERSGD